MDIKHYKKIINIGEQTVGKSFPKKFAKFAVDPKHYVKQKALKTKENNISPQIIDEIVIDNQIYMSADKLRSFLHVKVGDTSDNTN